MEYKKCECGDPTCDIMIPIINTKGKSARFARGHNFRGNNNPTYNGGSWLSNGYLKVPAPKDHPHRDAHGYYPLHRLIMEKKLGRYLDPSEQIHHIDGNKLNNDPENIQVLDRSGHSKITASINPQCQKKDMSDRVCLECNTVKTTIKKNGQPLWMYHPITKQGFVCERCYRKINRHLGTKVSYRRSLDIMDRKCIYCNRTKSETPTGRLIWYKSSDGRYICNNCYNKSRKKKSN